MLEHAGDEIGDEIEKRLEDAFITPIDREDIHELTRRMDDVVDRIQEIAEALQHLRRASAHGRSQAAGRHPRGAGRRARSAFRKFESMKGLTSTCGGSTTLENEADACRARPSADSSGRTTTRSRSSSGATSTRSLEESIDAAEDVSEIIQRVVHKGS